MRCVRIIPNSEYLYIALRYYPLIANVPASYVERSTVFVRGRTPSFFALIFGTDVLEPGEFRFRAASTATGLVVDFRYATNDLEHRLETYQDADRLRAFYACSVTYRYVSRHGEESAETIEIHVSTKRRELPPPSLV